MEDRYREVEKVIDDSIGWVMSKNRERLLECMAQNEEFFYFSPDENGTIRGFKSFVQLVDTLFMDERFKGVGHELRDLKINFSKNGDVAWYSCRLDDYNEWNGNPSNWENARWTGVLERADGKWKIVQMHFSFASE